MRTRVDLEVRPPTLDDLAEVVELGRAAEIVDCGVAEFTEDDLVHEWTELDLERNAWVVVADGRIGGYATFEERGGGRLTADGYVHPELTGRGIGSLLVRLTEERARKQLAEAVDGQRVYLQNGVLHSNAAALRLLERCGYRPVRHFFRMVSDLEEPPAQPVWPEGVRGAPFDPADARAVHAAIEEAFAEEWEHRPETFEEWEKRKLRDERFDPGLWVVARDGDEVAGAAVCTWKRMDVGWIDRLGVRPAWRRRGLGLALLQAAFGEFYRRGERRCGLGVDVQNPTGAIRLYERAGMRVLWQAVVFEKELRAGRPTR